MELAGGSEDLRAELDLDRRSPRKGDHQEVSDRDPRPLGKILVRCQAGVDPETKRVELVLKVVCAGRERTRVAIPVTWSVVPRIEVLPSRLSLGLRSPGESATARVVVRSGDSNPFRVLRLICDDSRAVFSARFDPKSSSRHEIDLDFRVPTEAGPWSTSLRMETDRPGAEALMLPVSSAVSGAARRE